MVKISFFTSFFKNIAFPVGAFLLAMLLWLFVVSGDQYTMMLDLPIEARNLNSQKTYLEEVPGYASVILKGKGRDLFKSYILQNYSDIKLVLDLDGISQEYEFILNDYFEENIERLFPKTTDRDIAESILYLCRNKDNIDNFNKKAIYIMIREMTDVKTSKITQVTNTFRKIYPRIQEEVLSRGHIDNLRYTGSLV